MREIENTAEELFNKIRGKFPGVVLGDEAAKVVTDPAQARFFNFDFKVDDRVYGNVTLSLLDKDTLNVIYGRSITSELTDEDKPIWFDFLRSLRKFSSRRMLGFEVRDISKKVLSKDDFKFLATGDSDVVSANESTSITESKMYGSKKSSYQKVGECRLIIRHSTAIDEEKRGSRARRISTVYIETREGERFKLPFNNLAGARAMARHVSSGGSTVDIVGAHITKLVDDKQKLSKFIRKTRNKQFAEADAQDIVEGAIKKYSSINKTLARLQSPRGYAAYIETTDIPESDGTSVPDSDIDKIRRKLVKSVVSDDIDDALPLVAQTFNELEDDKMNKLSEAASIFEQASFSLLLKEDPAADMIIMQSRFSDGASLMRNIMEDISSRSINQTLRTFAKSIVEKFDRLSDPEMLLASRIAKHYLSDLTKIKEDQTYKTEVRTAELAESKSFERWANRLSEQVWKKPNSNNVGELFELFNEPISLGVDGDSAIGTIASVLSADGLSDALYAASKATPDADARPVILSWLEEHMPDIARRVKSQVDNSVTESDEDLSPEEMYTRIKDWNQTALAGYARRVGIDDDIIDSMKNDRDSLVDEIMGYVYGDDWVITLIDKGAV
jgi:hypothetical protein